MAAVSVVLIGVGVYLLYEAVKSPTPTPVVKAKAALGATAKGG
jgi:hypothetical protein